MRHVLEELLLEAFVSRKELVMEDDVRNERKRDYSPSVAGGESKTEAVQPRPSKFPDSGRFGRLWGQSLVWASLDPWVDKLTSRHRRFLFSLSIKFLAACAQHRTFLSY